MLLLQEQIYALTRCYRDQYMCNFIRWDNLFTIHSVCNTAMNSNEEFKPDQKKSLYPISSLFTFNFWLWPTGSRLFSPWEKILLVELYNKFPWGQNFTQIKTISVCSLYRSLSVLECCLVPTFLNAKSCPDVLLFS